jgi:hypothetical protein
VLSKAWTDREDLYMEHKDAIRTVEKIEGRELHKGCDRKGLV